MPNDMLAALDAIKAVAKMFAPLATVSADVDRLAALVAHEDELKKSIDAKLEAVRVADADMADKLAATDAEIEERQRAHADVEAGYTAKIAEFNAEFHAARERAEQAAADAEENIRIACEKADAELATLKADLATERAEMTAAHNAFIEETKTKRAQIESNTAIMEATLRELRSQAKGALDAVQEHTA